MAKRDDFVDHIVDSLQFFCPAIAKPMFGGYGIYCGDLMFAIIIKGDLYVKVDDETRSLFEEKGLEKFSYLRQGKTCHLSYYTVPEEVIDDLDTLCYWAGLGYEAALRANK
ncbi:TfoX/Sxy family protein [Hydrogenovibrio kuenenii]|uniref:TfoX/Sxy family protein n=1 Tax=Hydrogenovibrio kuenenii TaxID=63658 RepID=UPI00046340CA|nr:TfoX/Sxy family protein [Hydrogenovibrio kuenenii]